MNKTCPDCKCRVLFILFFGGGRGRWGQSHRKSYGQHKAAEPVLPYNEADGGGEKDLSCSPLSAA